MNECCGAHEICEKDLLMIDSESDYFDDEELDRFRGRKSGDYSDEEIDEFLEILHTMREDEALGWTQSLERRRIELPDIVKDEALMIISQQESIK